REPWHQAKCLDMYIEMDDSKPDTRSRPQDRAEPLQTHQPATKRTQSAASLLDSLVICKAPPVPHTKSSPSLQQVAYRVLTVSFGLCRTPRPTPRTLS